MTGLEIWKVSGLALLAALSAVTANAFPEVPKASAKALKVTRGKPFSRGVVFVDGKYLEPPYVVERWGTGIRINSTPVTGPIVDWDEFLKTQDGVKVTKTEVAPPPPPPVAVVEEVTEVDDSDSSELDDLFDDDRKSGGKSAKRRSVVRPVAPPKPKVVVSYSLEGEFVPNEATKELVGKINSVRTDIDRILRSGGFIFFGERYSRVTGDEPTLKRMLEALPEIQQNSVSANELRKRVTEANLVYLNATLCEELFANRADYRKLMNLRERILPNRHLQKELEELARPLF